MQEKRGTPLLSGDDLIMELINPMFERLTAYGLKLAAMTLLSGIAVLAEESAAAVDGGSVIEQIAKVAISGYRDPRLQSARKELL